MKVHLMSYGNEKYALQREFFKQSAIASSFFDEILIYGQEDIDFYFNTQFQTLLNHEKGGGFWIWKPYLIKRVLSNLLKDQILIYCDAGSVINKEGGKRLKDYIDLLMESDTGSLAFELPKKEIEYTKKEVFDYFESPSGIVNSNQLMATVIMLRKCSHSTLLVDEWYTTLFKKPLLFADDRIINKQNEQFVDHRHDQSIFSVIRKTYGSKIISDETHFSDFIRMGQPYPFWTVRLRG